MEIEHGRAFLECALTGKKISQSTIMHAYQTCIKRIVRFANSLQVGTLGVNKIVQCLVVSRYVLSFLLTQCFYFYFYKSAHILCSKKAAN